MQGLTAVAPPGSVMAAAVDALMSEAASPESGATLGTTLAVALAPSTDMQGLVEATMAVESATAKEAAMSVPAAAAGVLAMAGAAVDGANPVQLVQTHSLLSNLHPCLEDEAAPPGLEDHAHIVRLKRCRGVLGQVRRSEACP